VGALPQGGGPGVRSSPAWLLPPQRAPPAAAAGGCGLQHWQQRRLWRPPGPWCWLAAASASWCWRRCWRSPVADWGGCVAGEGAAPSSERRRCGRPWRWLCVADREGGARGGAGSWGGVPFRLFGRRWHGRCGERGRAFPCLCRACLCVVCLDVLGCRERVCVCCVGWWCILFNTWSAPAEGAAGSLGGLGQPGQQQAVCVPSWGRPRVVRPLRLQCAAGGGRMQECVQLCASVDKRAAELLSGVSVLSRGVFLPLSSSRGGGRRSEGRLECAAKAGRRVEDNTTVFAGAACCFKTALCCVRGVVCVCVCVSVCEPGRADHAKLASQTLVRDSRTQPCHNQCSDT
jgi:hypothetical protein